MRTEFFKEIKLGIPGYVMKLKFFNYTQFHLILSILIQIGLDRV